jgi:hypothetical protein
VLTENNTVAGGTAQYLQNHEGPGTQLEGYMAETITVPPETMRESVSGDFALPPQQTP